MYVHIHTQTFLGWQFSTGILVLVFPWLPCQEHVAQCQYYFELQFVLVSAHFDPVFTPFVQVPA